MGNTLLEMYKDLIRCTDKWTYYNNPPYLSCNMLSNENDSLEFIKKYFSRGGKDALFEYADKELDIVKNRAPHIVSTYLLGIIIADIFHFDFCERDDKNMSLLYLWFLSCLYHDIGYIYEKNSCCEQLRKIQTGGLAALKKICNIKDYVEDEFQTYKKKEIDVYLSYRAKCSDGKMGVIDHGIAGGLILYDRLSKNYEQAWEKAFAVDRTITENSFCYNKLHFSKEHFSYYAKAADAIISHNIWKDTLRKCLEYNGEQCKRLLIKENNKIAFILALADTIEPIKKYGFFALKEIKLKRTENGFDLIMPVIDDEYKYLKDLPNWVEITVNETIKNTFSIKRKEKNVGILQ